MSIGVLIVDDERNLRRMLRAVLEAESYDVYEARDGVEAVQMCARVEPDVVLLDLIMEPGPDGLSVLEQLRAQSLDSIVIMMSGKATLSDAVQATKLGAFQFLEKPLSPEAVLTTVEAAVRLTLALRDNRALRAALPADHDIVGTSRAMDEVRTLIEQVAPTPARVLITGESGTGKELVARAIHRRSPRASRPMVSVNCAAVPGALLESEMFGHERGAFTGAVARRKGKFELADRSTLFLDEVGDMHLEAQAKLLRVLESGTIERLGGDRETAVDVRVIAATNKDLDREVRAGTFREDLLYRLRVFPIHVAPLRERMEDLPALVQHFAVLAGARCARNPRSFAADAMKRLRRHDWAGNVRELSNVVERLTIIGQEPSVSAREVDAVLGKSSRRRRRAAASAGTAGLTEELERLEAELISDALNRADGNVAEAARLLKTDRANLYRRMRRLNVSRIDTNVSQ